MHRGAHRDRASQSTVMAMHRQWQDAAEAGAILLPVNQLSRQLLRKHVLSSERTSSLVVGAAIFGVDGQRNGYLFFLRSLYFMKN